MGVHGLWQLLGSTGRPVPLDSLEGKVLAVDVSVWLHQLSKGMRDASGNPVSNAHLHGLFTRICKLLHYRIKPVFVFDGGVPTLKKQTLAVRRSRREDAEQTSRAVQQKILTNLIRTQALHEASGVGGPLVLPSTQKSKSTKDAIFELPPLPEHSQRYLEEMKNDPYGEDRQELQRIVEEEYGFGEMDNIDVDSEDFVGLPAEIQLEIITDLKERRKNYKNMSSINTLPEDSKDFSRFQMQKLLKHNKLNTRLESVRHEINTRQAKAIGGKFYDPDLYEADVHARKLASDDTAHYILISGIKKTLERKKLEADRKKRQEVEGFDKLDESPEESDNTDELLNDSDTDDTSDVDFLKSTKGMAVKLVPVQTESGVKSVEMQSNSSKQREEVTALGKRQRKTSGDSHRHWEREKKERFRPVIEIDSGSDSDDDDEGENSDELKKNITYTTSGSGDFDKFEADIVDIVSDSDKELQIAILKSLEKKDGQLTSKSATKSCSKVENRATEFLSQSNVKEKDMFQTNVEKSIKSSKRKDPVNVNDSTEIDCSGHCFDGEQVDESEKNANKRRKTKHLPVRCGTGRENMKKAAGIQSRRRSSLSEQKDLTQSTSANEVIRKSTNDMEKAATVLDTTDGMVTTRRGTVNDRKDSADVVGITSGKTMVGEITDGKTVTVSEDGVRKIRIESDEEDGERCESDSSEEDFIEVRIDPSTIMPDELFPASIFQYLPQKTEATKSFKTKDLTKAAEADTDTLNPKNAKHAKENQEIPIEVSDDEKAEEGEVGDSDNKSDKSCADIKDLPRNSNETDLTRKRILQSEPSSSSNDTFDDAMTQKQDNESNSEIFDTATLNRIHKQLTEQVADSEDSNPEDDSKVAVPEEVEGVIEDADDAMEGMEEDIEENAVDEADKGKSDTKKRRSPSPKVLDLVRAFKSLNEQSIHGMKEGLVAENRRLQQEMARQDRMTLSITDQMHADAQELLQLFGIPYLISPTEAEAQCAQLETSQLVHGTITDDSDIWLFGGQCVFKNFFNQQKHVECFKYDHIVSQLGLTRDGLVAIALLCGSDYTEGVPGVGPVTAMEILAEFPGSGVQCLTALKEWWTRVSREIKPSRTESKLRTKLRQLDFPGDFPNKMVVDAYLHPTVDDSKERFSWTMPDLNLLRKFASSRLGWSREKVDEILLPVLKRLNEKSTQRRISSYFQPEVYMQPTKMKSKRLQKVVTHFLNPTSTSTEVYGNSEQEHEENISNGQTTAVKTAQSDNVSAAKNVQKARQVSRRGKKNKTDNKDSGEDERGNMRKARQDDITGKKAASCERNETIASINTKAKRNLGSANTVTARTGNTNRLRGKIAAKKKTTSSSGKKIKLDDVEDSEDMESCHSLDSDSDSSDSSLLTFDSDFDSDSQVVERGLDIDEILNLRAGFKLEKRVKNEKSKSGPLKRVFDNKLNVTEILELDCENELFKEWSDDLAETENNISTEVAKTEATLRKKRETNNEKRVECFDAVENSAYSNDEEKVCGEQGVKRYNNGMEKMLKPSEFEEMSEFNPSFSCELNDLKLKESHIEEIKDHLNGAMEYVRNTSESGSETESSKNMASKTNVTENHAKGYSSLKMDGPSHNISDKSESGIAKEGPGTIEKGIRKTISKAENATENSEKLPSKKGGNAKTRACTKRGKNQKSVEVPGSLNKLVVGVPWAEKRKSGRRTGKGKVSELSRKIEPREVLQRKKQGEEKKPLIGCVNLSESDSDMD